MKARSKVRAIWVCVALVICFSGFSARLVELQVKQHEHWQKVARELHIKKIVTHGQRGAILDVKGETLADTEPRKVVLVDESLVTDSALIASQIAELLEIPEAELATRIVTPRRRVVVKTDVAKADGERMARELYERQVKGVAFEKGAEKNAPGVMFVDESLLLDSEKIRTTAAQILGVAPEVFLKEMRPARRYVVLKRGVSNAAAEEISKRLKEVKQRGVFFEPDSRRVYPNGNMLCHVLGFLNEKKRGIEGIEASMNELLSPQDGFRYSEQTRTGRELVPYRRQERPASNGKNVRLTIDMSLQSIVEAELEAAYKQYRPEMATAILMDPKTGRILALANRPCFDPNKLGSGKAEQTKNCAVMNIVEPGSTFKIFTVAAALNEKKVGLDTMVNCENGRFNFAGKILKDHGRGYGELSVADVLVHSSNIGSAKIAMRLGEQRFYEYIRSFGFGERTSVQLPGELSGIVAAPHRWSKISISRIPMGQGVAVTPLQLITGVAAIANGGKLMMPQIVDSVTDSEGKVVESYPPVVVREVVTPEVAAKVTSALKDVVSKRGTASQAAVPGFTVAGKTGTAQKSVRGGYSSEKYVVTFVGFLPAEDPRFVCLVMLDNARTSAELNYGGTVGGPVFAKIAAQVATYMNLQPSVEGLVPAAAQLTQAPSAVNRSR